MAYATTNPPILLMQGGQYGGALWKYDGTDTAATVDTVSFITNAKGLGMKKGDILLRTTWSALPTVPSDLESPTATAPTITTMGFHIVLGILADGSAELSDALALTVTNTD